VQKQRKVTFESFDLEFSGPPFDRRQFLVATITDFEINRTRIRNALGADAIRYALLKLQELFLNIGEPAAADVCAHLCTEVTAKRLLPDLPVCAELLQFLDCTIRELKDEANVHRFADSKNGVALQD
jgi:hypothetical protein